jgi:hypothetical protein
MVAPLRELEELRVEVAVADSLFADYALFVGRVDLRLRDLESRNNGLFSVGWGRLG